jgi:SAM-dependent methyltransferase
VVASDIDAQAVVRQRRLLRSLRLGDAAARVTVEQEDAVRMTFSDGSFDRVAAISVLEHIASPGDQQAMRELARVLRPDGSVVVTVPYGPAYREAQPPYAGLANHRVYDHNAIWTRLVAPSGLQLRSISYLGSRYDFEGRIWNHIPWRLARASGWLGPLLANTLFWASPAPRPWARGVVLVLD